MAPTTTKASTARKTSAASKHASKSNTPASATVTTTPTHTKKRVTPLRLPPETLGARFHRAYKLARRTTRPGLIHRDFEQNADLAKFVSISSGTVSRWEDQLIDIKTTQRRTLIAVYYCLVFMGVDPRDFDLTPESLGLDKETAKRAAELLTPLSLWIRVSAA